MVKIFDFYASFQVDIIFRLGYNIFVLDDVFINYLFFLFIHFHVSFKGYLMSSEMKTS